MLFVVLIFALHLIHIESRTIFGRHVIAAAIFGNKGENSKNTDGSQASLKTKPPPPPGRPPLLNGQKTSAAIPPPPPPMAMKNETPADGSTKGARNSEVQPPPPPPMQQEGKGWVQNDNIAANQEWMDYQQPSQQQFPFFPESHGYDPHMNQWPSLEQQLQDSLARENELYGQIQNFTATINAMEQQNQLHVRQMDVLTERIMDAENQIAKERNTALEYEANCTELGRQIASLHQELEDWQARCAEFADKQQANDSKIKELKRDLKAARAEAENLAISIENSRIRDQMGDNASKKKKKSRGLFGWLFSFFVSPTEPEVDTEDDQDPQVS